MIIELLPHLDAVAPSSWAGPPDKRPLSAPGQRQAAAVADAIMSQGEIAALYSSPALRCRQSLAHLSERLGMDVVVSSALREFGEAEGLADGVERGLAALDEIAVAWPGQRVVVCSHGDIVPATVLLLAHRHSLRVAEFTRRGQWYSIERDGDALRIELREAGG